MLLVPSMERHGEDQGADSKRLDLLRDHVRSSLRIARLVLDEVLDSRFSEDEPEKYRNLASKAGGELAMLLRLAKRALPGDEDDREIFGLARDLAPHARAPHVYRCLLLRPSRASMYALAHFCLTELGIADEKIDRAARLALRSSVSAANERVPYRMLDAAWTRHIVFGRSELNHSAIPLSPLGAGVDLLEASTEDAYAFTHALPYATDFGRFPLPDNISRRYLLSIAEAIAVKALDEDDLDLLAEVLMAPAILRLPWTPTLSFAWNVLERVWNEFGFVPGPGVPPATANETRAQSVRRVLGTTYHTCFAAGLCCATLVACNHAPLHEIKNDEPGNATAPEGKGAMWKIKWNESSQQVQDSLTFLRLAFSLRRSVEEMELVRIRELLLEAAQAQMSDHPLFMQALELLERVNA